MVRAVLLKYPNGEQEWLCAQIDQEGEWCVPDTQCGGYFKLYEDCVLISVDVPEEPAKD